MTLGKLIEKRWLHHLLFWIVLVVPFSLVLGGQPQYSYAQAFRDVILQALAYAIMVYINLQVLIPRYLQQRKFGAYFGLLFVFLALTIPIHSMADYYSDFNASRRMNGTIDYTELLFLSFINMAVMLSLTTALKFAKKWFVHQREHQTLEREKLQAELKYLKAQINPHFLFNTLNNLYSLTLKKSDQAPEMVLKLSEMMRYMLYHSNERKVPIEKEIEYMKNYIDLEKIRQLDKTEIKFEVDEALYGNSIAPLLLIPFLENSFKHGVNNNTEPSWVNIIMKKSCGNMDLVIENSKPTKVAKLNGKDHGIGLVNVKRRLDLLYPDRYNLKIEDTPTHYRTELNLELYEI